MFVQEVCQSEEQGVSVAMDARDGFGCQGRRGIAGEVRVRVRAVMGAACFSAGVFQNTTGLRGMGVGNLATQGGQWVAL